MVWDAIYCPYMARAIVVLREKIIDAQGNIFEFVIWRLPVTPRSPSGVRYRLAFVRREETRPMSSTTITPRRGHHRHVAGVEEPYRFVDVDQLVADFMADVQRMGEGRWPKR